MTETFSTLGPSATSLQLHAGMVTGSSPLARRTPVSDRSARETIEAILLEQMLKGEVAVQFSGGRDSSLILALACHVARQHGMPIPEAVSVRYPGTIGTDESEWQDFIADHVGARLQVVAVPAGEDEFCSTYARAQLDRHGPRFPAPPAVMMGRLAAEAGGRTMLTGEVGDEILGPSRITLFVAHWRRRRRPSKAAMAEMVRQVLPRGLRRRVARGMVSSQQPAFWLREPLQSLLHDEMTADLLAEPWRWDDARWTLIESNSWILGRASMDEVAALEGFAVRHPLTDPDFVGALNREGGALGLTSRQEAMRLLAGDLLPEALIKRSDKAFFNNVYAGGAVRAFAESWDGSGIDDAIVDIDRLRSAWLADEVPANALIPLQLAVLASDNGRCRT